MFIRGIAGLRRSHLFDAFQGHAPPRCRCRKLKGTQGLLRQRLVPNDIFHVVLEKLCPGKPLGRLFVLVHLPVNRSDVRIRPAETGSVTEHSSQCCARSFSNDRWGIFTRLTLPRPPAAARAHNNREGAREPVRRQSKSKRLRDTGIRYERRMLKGGCCLPLHFDPTCDNTFLRGDVSHVQA